MAQKIKISTTHFIFLLIIVFLYSCNYNNPRIDHKKEKQLTEEGYRLFIDSNPIITDKSSPNDWIEGSLYRNNRYKFRIRFPEKWEIVKGDGKSVVIKAIQPDSGKSILVLVTEFKDIILKNKSSSADSKERLKSFIAEIAKRQNISPFDIKIEDSYLNNFPATHLVAKVIHKTRDIELVYILDQYVCDLDGRMYAISVTMPLVFYDLKEAERMNRIIDSLVFELII